MVNIRLKIGTKDSHAHIHMYVMDETMNPIICYPVVDENGDLYQFPSGNIEFAMSLGTIELCSGKYTFAIGVIDINSKEILTRVQGICPFRVNSKKAYWGKIIRHSVPSEIKFPSDVEADILRL